MINSEIAATDSKNIEKLLNDSSSFLEKGYLSNKENFEIVKIQDEIKSLSFSTGIRMLKLNKIVYDEKENILDKLSNVFTALYGNNTTLFLILDSDGETCNFYLGVKDENAITRSFSTLKASLSGNFSGIEYNDQLDTKKIENLMKNILKDEIMEISTVTGIPSLKSENKESFLQGIEKVIDGMEGKKFSAIFIADPIQYKKIKEIKRGYENIYNQLYPYVDLNISLNKSEALALSKSSGETFSKNYSTNLSKTDTINKSFTTSRNQSESFSHSGNLGLPGAIIGGGLGLLAGPVGGAIGAYVGNKIGEGLGNVSKTKTSGGSKAETYGTSLSNTFGETYGETKSYQDTFTENETMTEGKTLQINQKNKILENLLKKIDQHLERIELAEGNGLWNIGTYFLSEDPQNSIVAANIYNGIIRGKISGIEKNTVCTFDTYKDLEEVKDYLYNFSNPILKIKMPDIDIFSSMGSHITNDELALKLNFPQKSVTGLDVIKMASFGRNKKIENKDKSIEIGSLYHLGKEYKTKIGLDIESLASHTFITGSTGSGKSNSIYSILEELYKKNINFLIIEPAKGEYKNIFGGRDNVNVYGTNKNISQVLKINPFSFNENIHILEHIDRLVEIFNACWPMYAAMPAILKDAIEKAYMMVGWDLKQSINLYGYKKYPNLGLLKNSLREVINNSSYSQESKSNYSGALVTRVNSLENGLIGNIFCEDEVSERILFDKNTIIDISRIPSSETKALVMGIVFMKLHEYRMSSHIEENTPLKHVTILEEAHNLLKKTSIDQSMEGANLQGKSVEMMVNAIAEMRTYGEGFIIADQAPGLLDESVIRNTNTKICLRLPSLDDREIVGRSMNLNDHQIEELSKLDTGVAAIIQTNWKEACLVKFNYMSNKNKYTHIKNTEDKYLLRDVLKVLLEKRLPDSEKLEESKKRKILSNLEKNKFNLSKTSDKDLDSYIFKLIEGDKILNIVNAMSSKNIQEWNDKIQAILINILNLNTTEKFIRIEVANSIVRENTIKNPEYENFYKEWDEFLREGKAL